MTEHDHEVSFKTVLFGENKRKYLGFFLAIITFYVCWNLLANTWGQFQTYALTNAGASQTQATGLGIILNVVALGTTIVFTSISGGKYRNKAFFVGAFVQFAAMLGMVLIGGGAGFIALATTIAFYNFGEDGQEKEDQLIAGFDESDTIIPNINETDCSALISLNSKKHIPKKMLV